jgi:hypothetical protein
MSNDSKSFLSSGGPKALAFATPGTSHTGTVVGDPKESQQMSPDGELKTWRDGNPMMQLVVTIDTGKQEDEEDDGLRRLFIKGQLRKAFQTALSEAGAEELLPGGNVTVTYTHDGERSNPAYSPPKQYAVVYVPPKASSTNGSGTVEAAAVPVPENLPAGMTPEIWAGLPEAARAALQAL